MEIVFTLKAKADLLVWKKSGNSTIQKKITALLNSIKITPYSGIGKPEALKYELAGKWSRRITLEDRLVYEVNDTKQMVFILSLKGHY